MSRFSTLDQQASIRVVREGGVAAMPGLMKPRQIDFRRCSDEQRRRICSILDEADRCLPLGEPPGRGDQRFFRILVWQSSDGEPNEEQRSSPSDELKVPETHAPESLVALWRDGPGADG